MRNTPVFVILLCLCLACSGGERPEEILMQAERYLSVNTDSARLCLEEIGRPDRLPMHEQAMYTYVQTAIEWQKGDESAADSAFLHAAQLFEKTNDTIRYVRALYWAGRASKELKKHTQADSIFVHALTIAPPETGLQYALLEYAGYNMLDDNKPREALRYHRELTADIDSFPPARKASYLGALGQSYQYTGESDSALSCYNRAIDYFREADLPGYTPFYYYKVSDIYKEKKQTAQALAALKSAMEEESRHDVPANMLTRALVYLSTRENDSVRVYLQKAIQGSDPYVSARAYEYLTDLTNRQSNGEKAFLNWQNRKVARDNIQFRTSYAILEQRFQDTQLRNENNELKLKQNQQEIYLLLLCLAVVIATSAGIIFYMRERRNKMRRELKLQEWKLRDEIAHLEHEREVFELNERAAGMRAQLFRQLAASEKLPSLHQPKKVGRPKKRTEEEEKIARLTTQEIEEIEKLVNNTIWTGFARRLKESYPTLRQNEIQFCCLIKAGITAKELETIYSISKWAVSQRKIRIKRNRFGLIDDPRPLDQILAGFK